MWFIDCSCRSCEEHSEGWSIHTVPTASWPTELRGQRLNFQAHPFMETSVFMLFFLCIGSTFASAFKRVRQILYSSLELIKHHECSRAVTAWHCTGVAESWWNVTTVWGAVCCRGAGTTCPVWSPTAEGRHSWYIVQHVYEYLHVCLSALWHALHAVTIL